ncbi:hypothetical protein J2T15_006324, partial [Paenibacillus harenae]|nr:hypothetical protein [Paenibacillus harenae]
HHFFISHNYTRVKSCEFMSLGEETESFRGSLMTCMKFFRVDFQHISTKLLRQLSNVFIG